MTYLAKNLKKIRSIHKLNQSDLAEMFGLSRANIGSYEEGRAQPKLEIIVQIANHFKIPLEKLINAELSVNEITHFEDKTPVNESPLTIQNNQNVKELDWIFETNYRSFISVGKSKHKLTLPLHFEGDICISLENDHLEIDKNLIKGSVIIGKKIKTEQLSPEKLSIALFQESIQMGYFIIENNALKNENKNLATTIPLTSVRRLVEVCGIIQNNSFSENNFEKRLTRIEREITDIKKRLS